MTVWLHWILFGGRQGGGGHANVVVWPNPLPLRPKNCINIVRCQPGRRAHYHLHFDRPNGPRVIEMQEAAAAACLRKKGCQRRTDSWSLLFNIADVHRRKEFLVFRRLTRINPSTVWQGRRVCGRNIQRQRELAS